MYLLVEAMGIEPMSVIKQHLSTPCVVFEYTYINASKTELLTQASFVIQTGYATKKSRLKALSDYYVQAVLIDTHTPASLLNLSD